SESVEPAETLTVPETPRALTAGRSRFGPSTPPVPTVRPELVRLSVPAVQVRREGAPLRASAPAEIVPPASVRRVVPAAKTLSVRLAVRLPLPLTLSTPGAPAAKSEPPTYTFAALTTPSERV